MHKHGLFALLTSLSLSSALPQASSTSSTTGASSSYSNGSTILTSSFNALYTAGDQWASDHLNFTGKQHSVYKIFATTDFPTSANLAANNTQLPITEMDIKWLPGGHNSTRLVDEDNISTNTPGEWSSSEDKITSDQSKKNLVFLPAGRVQRLPDALDFLASKGQPGPWNEITITVPANDPLNKTDIRSAQLQWFEFLSYANDTQSFMVCPEAGRILKMLH